VDFINSQIFIHLFWSIPVIALILYYASKRREKLLHLLLGEEMGRRLTITLNKSARVRKSAYFILFWILLFSAAARPWWGKKLSDVKVTSRDVLVCLDTSRSMLAQDISPTRLQHAKWWTKELAKKCEGDRFGLINFAGEAILECPLTSSQSSFLDYLENSDTNSIPVGGTNIGAALNIALNAFKGAEGSHQAIILITDGDELQGDSMELLEEIKELQIPIITVGIGDPNEPGVIQLPDGKILRDSEGNPVISKLNESGLVRIAKATNGIYARTTSTETMLNEVYERIEQLTPEHKEMQKQNQKIERFRIPLILALLFLMMKLFASERRRKITAVLLFLLTISNSSFAEEDVPAQLIPAENQTEQLTEGKTTEFDDEIAALENRLDEELTEQEEDKVYYNLGTLYQKKGDLEKASEYLNEVSANPHPEIFKRTMNNLSTIELQKAIKTLSSDPDKSIESLNQAEYYLKQALTAAKGDKETVKKVQNNIKSLYKYKTTAKLIKQFADKVKELKEEVVKNSTDALAKQAESDKEENLQQKMSKNREIQSALQKAQKSLPQLTHLLEQAKMPEEELKKLKSAGDDLKVAEEAVKKQMMPLSKESSRKESDKAKQAIMSALQKLGVPPQQQQQNQNQQQKDGEQKDGQQNQQNQQEQQQTGEEKQKDDNQSQSPDNKEKQNAESLDKALKDLKDKKGEKQTAQPQHIRKINKEQAETILRSMKMKEKDLKKELKKIQQKRYRKSQQNEKNW